MWQIGTWLSGQFGSAWLVIWLHDHKSLCQPQKFYEFMILMHAKNSRVGFKKGPDFSVVPSNSARDDNKLKDGKRHLNIRKAFFSLKLTEHQNKLFREVAETSSMDIFKTQMDLIPSNLLQVNLFQQSRAFGLHDI